MAKFKEHLNTEKENLEEAVDTGRGKVEHATVTFNDMDGMFIQLRGKTFNLDLTPNQMKAIAKGQPARGVPFITK